MSNFVDIINSIKNPLALAALFILILSAIMTTILRTSKKSPLNPRVILSLIRYLFSAAILFGIIAMIGYFIPTPNPNIIISGTLVDAQTHRPIPYITVSLSGLIGSGSRNMDTDDEGNFNFTVSRSTMSPDVKINISDDDYQHVSQAVPISDSTLIIELSKAILDKNIFKSVEFGVSHWTGFPIVKAFVQLYNRNNGTIRVTGLSDITLTKVGDGAKTTIGINLFGSSPMKKIYLRPGRNANLFGFFFTTPTGAGELANAVFSEASHNMQLSEHLTHRLQTFAEENFFWTPGQWVIELTVDCEDQPRTFTKKFTLTDQQVGALRGIINNYKYGYGVTNNSMLNDNSLYLIIK
ncbi:hypothetical protein SB00094_02466 [Klebsiella variicola subsp. tropica]|uniref:carboxypeptidase-like regulatory domain-containing protein n=1 Tax=Klebsiella variicola TaxID=244366 RepID=UPI000A479673|nr:carboxypeptidase-like regulatory domain-containing protein [Klebsiella variicola]UDC28469.1 carboxypeptidase-like regulatory domain-containing protein [Klebsiella variicola subsp. tropica]VGP52595.1 hypothetical protein SB00094_02466 [Klebsiella variicola subsp. tropica]VGQ09057.1 hypothetical protein SB5544_04642 [Klebsiella variicola]